MEEVVYWSQWKGVNGEYQIGVIGVDRASYRVEILKWLSHWKWQETLYEGNNFQQAMNTAYECEYKYFQLNNYSQVDGSAFKG